MRFLKVFIPYTILLVGILGLFDWKSIRKNYWKFFPPYLIIMGLIEISRRACIEISSVYAFLTILTVPIEFLFFFWLLSKYSQMKLPIITGGVVYLLVCFIEFAEINTLSNDYFMSFSYSVGNIILLILILQYFYKLIYSDKILFFYQERMFWVSLGLLVYFLGTLPYFALFNLMLSKYFDLFVSYSWIQIFLNYTMYLLFAASFIWGEKEK